ncbi:protein fuzzy homolog [Chrysoperla carnea]|uniref:protein fuzzy homolog n=1 Tax=Chrysoperla carnea TaxID=189513 RepID=UPI001D0764F4|nr:protein fuzzy homolog [Chrysoperla carnea]
MSLNVMCLTSSGGLPLFIRKKGDTINLPFSTVAALNGVHMFGKSHNIELLNTGTENAAIVWKEFQDSIVLIGIAHETSEEIISLLLESIFHAMVLTVGLEDIKNQRNVERLKRDLRISFPLIDRLLECVDTASTVNEIVDLVGLSEVILTPENHLLQTVLDTYAECMDSLYGCLLIHGRIAVATKNWWSLHPDERKLLSLLISTDNLATARDIPIFLPYKSPEVAFRLVTCTLIKNVVVCTICGPAPELAEVDHIVVQCFKTMVEVLKSAEQCYPRNFPQSLQLAPEILGLLLINTDDKKFMLSRNAQQVSKKRSLSGMHRLDTLRTFYYESVKTFLMPTNDADPEEEDANSEAHETYWCSEYHKCHALKVANNILCLLYTSAVQTHTMRLMSQKTLKDLISDKQLCW